MTVYVFKTDIQNATQKSVIGATFSEIPSIHEWSVDIEDCDKVLRIVANGQDLENELIKMVQKFGFTCKILDY